MDWPGGLAVAALAEASALGAWVYAGIAEAGCVAISRAAERLAGRGAGCLAAVFWIASPMVWTLSLTRHTHLVSRTLIVFALLACAHLWCGRKDGSEPERVARLGWPLLLGASVGFSFLCRPAETAAIMAPAGVYLMWRGVWEAGLARRQLALAALGLLPFLALMALYNQLQTGQAWVSPRGLPQAVRATVGELSVGERLGANLSFNLMMLGVWFLGVAGLPLAYMGALRRDVLPRLCFLGLGLHLLVALAHENVGIHMVGPIHYSESVVPLILLASVGTARLGELASGPMRRLAGPSLLGYLLALAGFAALYAPSLGGLGRVADIPHAAARAANLRNAVVLSPAPHQIERLTPGSNGSWQHLHAPPDSKLRGDVLFVRHALACVAPTPPPPPSSSSATW